MNQKVKRAILGRIYPIGKSATIRQGFLIGMKIKITTNSGWSPIFGRWEPVNQLVFSEYIKKDQIVFDLGSNNGLHSMLFSKLVGKEGKVVAFEPLQSNTDEIRENIRLNKLENIHIVSKAVSNQTGKIRFIIGQHDKQGSIVGIGRETENEIEVESITIDEFVKDSRIEPDFIKIDVEGAESRVLEGATETLKKKPVLFIELHTPEQDVAVGKLLKEYNYKAFRINASISNNKVKLGNLEEINDLEKGWPHKDGIWGNIICT